MKIVLYALLVLLLCSPSLASQVSHPYPYCSNKLPDSRPIIVAYLGSDSPWQIKKSETAKLGQALAHIDLLNYAFIRFNQNNSGAIILNITKQDVHNFNLIRTLRPKLPIILSIGGWKGRHDFKKMLTNHDKRKQFINSVYTTLKKYHLDGVDIDWENEQLANQDEINGLVVLLHQLSIKLHPKGYCVSNAVPATPAIWNSYPDPHRWQSNVNWTTIMAYDHYGTFGPRTELASSLYASHHPIENHHYPYHTTSGNRAVKYYVNHGLPANKILLGIPFYCHSYYLENHTLNRTHPNPGLHVPVYDPNISSQIAYKTLFQSPIKHFTPYQLILGSKKFHATTFYWLTPVPGTQLTEFLSCESPRSINDKMQYIKGINALHIKLRGISFWSLSQDLNYSNQYSLLRAINQKLS